MMREMWTASFVALLSLMLVSGSAQAQIVIERDKSDAAPGANGIVVHLGRLEVHIRNDVLDISEFEDPSVDLGEFDRPQDASNLNIRLTLSMLPSAASAGSERIAVLTSLLQRLSAAAARQCEPIVAVFGKNCHLSQWNLNASFRATDGRLQDGASANLRVETAPSEGTPRIRK